MVCDGWWIRLPSSRGSRRSADGSGSCEVLPVLRRLLLLLHRMELALEVEQRIGCHLAQGTAGTSLGALGATLERVKHDGSRHVGRFDAQPCHQHVVACVSPKVQYLLAVAARGRRQCLQLLVVGEGGAVD